MKAPPAQAQEWGCRSGRRHAQRRPAFAHTEESRGAVARRSTRLPRAARSTCRWRRRLAWGHLPQRVRLARQRKHGRAHSRRNAACEPGLFAAARPACCNGRQRQGDDRQEEIAGEGEGEDAQPLQRGEDDQCDGRAPHRAWMPAQQPSPATARGMSASSRIPNPTTGCRRPRAGKGMSSSRCASQRRSNPPRRRRRPARARGTLSAAASVAPVRLQRAASSSDRRAWPATRRARMHARMQARIDGIRRENRSRQAGSATVGRRARASRRSDTWQGQMRDAPKSTGSRRLMVASATLTTTAPAATIWLTCAARVKACASFPSSISSASQASQAPSLQLSPTPRIVSAARMAAKSGRRR